MIFTPDVMTQYLMLFNTLWRAKRMEWVLSCTWKKLASLHKMARQLPELSPVLHLANLVASEMIHFIHQMAYYTTFEVRFLTIFLKGTDLFKILATFIYLFIYCFIC